MAFHQLDENGKPISKKTRTSRKPATRKERGIPMFHYMIVVSIPQKNGKYKFIRRRFWLPDDEAARNKERELKTRAPADALTWEDGYSKWREELKGRRSQGHFEGVQGTMNKWLADFGVKSTIEGTPLPTFVEWISEQAKGTKGRGAQLHQSHLITIAKWCRSRGFITTIPFEHAPKPEATLDKRRAATIMEFMEISDLLPPQMYWMWWLMGLTGMRISAACNLLEVDIQRDCLTVTTKADKRVEYPVTPGIQKVIDGARTWKKEKGFAPPTLFCSHRGRTWVHYTFSEQLRKHAPKYKITPHQLRHMAGTIMAEGNLSPDIIQAGLGHDDRSSAEVYIDQTTTMRKAALTAVSDALKKVKIKSKNARNILNANHNEGKPIQATVNKSRIITCPCCNAKILINKEIKK